MESYKLHKNFRKFLLNESSNSEGLCLYHHGEGSNYQRIVIYKPVPYTSDVPYEKWLRRIYLDTVIVGAIAFQNTESTLSEPCIPETFYVAAIHTHKDYEGQGFQKLLMDCAFYALGKDGKGLTSDQDTGTKQRAARAWDKIEKSGEYEKRKTKKGNDKFDYLDATPDPDDDCRMPMKFPTTMHSFQKKNLSDAKTQYETLKGNHDSFGEDLGYNKSTFENMLKNRSLEDFRVRFRGY
jgi:GNAT superfamily N-acetyltransferase